MVWVELTRRFTWMDYMMQVLVDNEKFIDASHTLIGSCAMTQMRITTQMLTHAFFL